MSPARAGLWVQFRLLVGLELAVCETRASFIWSLMHPPWHSPVVSPSVLVLMPPRLAVEVRAGGGAWDAGGLASGKTQGWGLRWVEVGKGAQCHEDRPLLAWPLCPPLHGVGGLAGDQRSTRVSPGRPSRQEAPSQHRTMRAL